MNRHVRNAALSGAATLALATVDAPPAGWERGCPPPSRGARSAALVASSYNAETHTVDAVLSTGARVQRWYGFEELLISASGIDLRRATAGQVKLLDSHNASSVLNVLGTISNVRIENGELVATLTFDQSPAGIAAEGQVSRRVVTGISIGYGVSVWTVTEAVGEVDVYQASRWELLEVSLVSVPADPNAGVRSAVPQPGNPSANSGGANEEEDMHLRNSPAAPAAVVAAPAAPATVAAPAAAAAPAATRAADAPAAPASSVAVLSRFGAGDALDFVAQGRDFGLETEARTMVDQNTRGEISVETARSAMLSKAAERQRTVTGPTGGPTAAVIVGDDARDKWMRGAMNGILHRAGLAELIARAAKARGETIDLNPGEFRGIKNVDLARMALENMGQRISSYDHNLIVSTALTSVRAGQATGDFPVLLENTLNKVLQAGYAVTPDTWTRFCGKGSLKDFRPHPRYLRGTFGSLDSLTENGEFKNKPIPDGAKESITGKTKGNIVALTRQAIVNDDMGAFSDIAVDLARAAKLTVEVDVYALLALNSGAGPNMNDGNPLFYSGHNNIASVNAAPSVAAFDALGALMAAQKDLSGNEFLDIRPAVWLGPRTLWGTAATTNGAEYDPDTASKLMRPNIVKGMFNDIVGTPRLTGTRWYAFADPAFNPAIEVAFLDGIQEPFLEQQNGWRTDGSEWKVRLDYGVGAINYRSAATNAGA